MIKRLATCLITLLTILHTGNAQDEMSDEDLLQLSLEELLNLDVEVASKSKESLTDAPGIIQVITSSEIKSFGAVSLTDVIDRTTGGFLISGTGFPNNVTSFRGVDSESLDRRVLLMINGRPVRESVSGGLNFPMYNAFPINTIDRIEIIRGPGSVLYGSNAYYGVINIITKSEENSSGSLSPLIGSFGAAGASGDYSFVDDDLRIMGAFNWFDEEGWDFNATDLFGVTDEANYYDDNTSFLLNSSYRNFDVNFLYISTETSYFAPTIPAWIAPPPQAQFDDPTNKLHDINRVFSDIGYNFDLSDNFNSSFNITYNHLKWEGNSDVFEGTTDNDANDFIFETSNKYEDSENFNFLLGGAVYLQNGAFESLSIESYNKTWYSVYFQADYQLIDPLKIVIGGQYNNIDGDVDDFVPRVSLISNFSENVGLKLLWGQSFRAPFAIETETNSPGNLIGSSTLESEKLTNFDAQLFYTGDKFESYLTYFTLSSADQIGLVQLNPGTADPTLTYANGSSDLKGSGIEWENKFVASNNFFITWSFMHQENETEVNGEDFDDASSLPNTMFKIGTSYQTNSRSLIIGVFNTYLSDFNTGLTGQIQPPLETNNPASSFSQLSINANVSLAKLLGSDFGFLDDIELNVYGTNILDEEINFVETNSLINTIPGRPGRAFYGSINLIF